jgi:ribonuclease HI
LSANFHSTLHSAIERQLPQFDVPINQLDLEAFLVNGDGRESRWMVDLVAYVDGGSLGNPGPAGVGVVIEGSGQGRITIGKWIGRQDNNVAEYLALLEALQCALELNACRLHVYSDSEVVVRQMMGHYDCRSPRLYSLHWVCRKLARSLQFSISHIRREHNAEANRLASVAARRTSHEPAVGFLLENPTGDGSPGSILVL